MTMSDEWRRGPYKISTDRSQLNTNLIHGYLSNSSYWATGRSLDAVERSIENSLCFGLYEMSTEQQQQIGFARVVTDYATFAWLADVFVLEEFRGQGLAKWLIEVVMTHPQLQGFRRWLLATKDAHDLYRRCGFKELSEPARWMERCEQP